MLAREGRESAYIKKGKKFRYVREREEHKKEKKREENEKERTRRAILAAIIGGLSTRCWWSTECRCLLICSSCARC